MFDIWRPHPTAEVRYRGPHHGLQRKCWMNIKEWTSPPMPKLPTRTSCRKDWNRISAESSLMSPWWPNWSRDWTELNSLSLLRLRGPGIILASKDALQKFLLFLQARWAMNNILVTHNLDVHYECSMWPCILALFTWNFICLENLSSQSTLTPESFLTSDFCIYPVFTSLTSHAV